MKRPIVLAVLGAFAVLVAAVMVFIVPWPDANHRSAEQVARTAGIPAGVTPGPPP